MLNILCTILCHAMYVHCRAIAAPPPTTILMILLHHIVRHPATRGSTVQGFTRLCSTTAAPSPHEHHPALCSETLMGLLPLAAISIFPAACSEAPLGLTPTLLGTLSMQFPASVRITTVRTRSKPNTSILSGRPSAAPEHGQVARAGQVSRGGSSSEGRNGGIPKTLR